MTLTVRRLAAEDAEASRQLGHEAFGMPASPPTEPAALDRAGAVYYGSFDRTTLTGRLADRDFGSYIGGVEVATAGIAGVTVAAEYRGRGGLTDLFTAALTGARERGAVISTLFPTAARIYRRFGYELVSDYATVQLPTAALAAVPRPAGVSVRRAEVGDLPAVRAVYNRWAAAQNGPLTRRGVSFPTTDAELLADVTGITMVTDGEGEVCGFASWDRGQGYGDPAVLEVSDLLALTADGYRALLATLGSFASVTPNTKIDTSGEDPVRYFLPIARWPVSRSDPYMLAVLDVPGAFAARGYPTGVSARLSFAVSGGILDGQDGTYTLEVAGGAGRCTRADGDGRRVFTARGLALAYAGVQSCANLRLAGLLIGGDAGEDDLWDALLGGRPFHIRDYF